MANTEVAEYVAALDEKLPLGSDPISYGDDHIRLIKGALVNTFPSLTGKVTADHTELNYVDGVTSSIQDQLNQHTADIDTGAQALTALDNNVKKNAGDIADLRVDVNKNTDDINSIISDVSYLNSGVVKTTGDQSIAGNKTFTANVKAPDFIATSDERFKENIVTAPADVISKLRGVEFTWKDGGHKASGVIAQELESVLPHLVHQDDEGMKSVAYNGLISYLIEEVKALRAEVESMK